MGTSYLLLDTVSDVCAVMFYDVHTGRGKLFNADNEFELSFYFGGMPLSFVSEA